MGKVPFRSSVVAVVAVVMAVLSTATAQLPPGQLEQISRDLAVGDTQNASRLEHEGRLLEAEQFYARAVHADRGFLPGVLGLARVLAAQNRPEEARQALHDVLARAMQNDDDRIQLALAHVALHDVDTALIVLDPRSDHPDIVRTRAEVCARTGRFVQALAEARRLVTLVRGQSSEPTARAMIAALELLTGPLDPVRQPGRDAMRSPVRRLLMRAP